MGKGRVDKPCSFHVCFSTLSQQVLGMALERKARFVVSSHVGAGT